MHESIDPIERQLTGLPHMPVPANLRAAALRGIERQLRAQRWERRLLRIAAVVFVTGFVLNLAILWRDNRMPGRDTFATLNSESLAQIVVAVSDVTDAKTGGTIARQFAALYGEMLSDSQIADLQRQARARAVGAGAFKKG